jgi:hypothetical protein
MNVAKVKKIIEKVKLPDWVLDWRVTEDLDADNEPILRVWFDVEPGLDVRSTHEETMAVQDEIRSKLRDADIDEWLVIILESPIRG